MFRRKEEHIADGGDERATHSQNNMSAEQSSGFRQQRPAPTQSRAGGVDESRMRKPVPTREARQPNNVVNRFERTPRPSPSAPSEAPAQSARPAAPTTSSAAPASAPVSAPVARPEISAAKATAPESTPTSMRMPLATKEPIPSPIVEELKQSVTDRIQRSVSGAYEQPERRPSEKRVLTVGQDTVLKGEIATCDRLIVEGIVDAVLSDVHTIEIAESGMFKGAAKVEDAEVSGQFDGDLEVSGRLTIMETGRITGKVSYSEIEIHRGGMITGKVLLAGANSSQRQHHMEEAGELADELA